MHYSKTFVKHHYCIVHSEHYRDVILLSVLSIYWFYTQSPIYTAIIIFLINLGDIDGQIIVNATGLLLICSLGFGYVT